MASRSVIHPGEESESSADEAYSDHEAVTSADNYEIDTSGAAAPAASRPPTTPASVPSRPPPSRVQRFADSLLHQKLREANGSLHSAIKLQITAPYQKATRNVQSLTYSLSRIQTSMSEACLQLQQIRDDLKATEEKTFDIVSSDYLVDVKI